MTELGSTWKPHWKVKSGTKRYSAKPQNLEQMLRDQNVSLFQGIVWPRCLLSTHQYCFRQVLTLMLFSKSHNWTLMINTNYINYANQKTKYANQNTMYAKQNTNYAISIKRVWQNIARGTTDPGYWLFNLSYRSSWIECHLHWLQIWFQLVPNLANM